MNKKKIFISIMGIAMALVLLGAGTFAWYTISTKGTAEINVRIVNDGRNWPFEVSTDYVDEKTHATKSDANWAKELNIKGSFRYDGKTPTVKDGLLRPISTADLKHWYLATYDPYGNVDGFREVPLSDVANRAEGRKYIKDDDDESYSEDGINYLNYFDIWIRTRDDSVTAYGLRLNNPIKKDGTYGDEWEKDFGTYVIWKPTSSNAISNEAMASIRFGFVIYDQETQDTDTELIDKIIIYEPNADFHPDMSTYGSYTAMKELGYINTESGVSTVESHSSIQDGVIYQTLVPQYASGSQAQLVEQTAAMTAKNPNVKNEGIVVTQKQSSWDMDKIKELDDISRIDTTCIDEIGEFCDREGNPKTNLEQEVWAEIGIDRVQKIRVFYWLEGQDIDCWNEITTEGLVANLEFSGVSVNP